MKNEGGAEKIYTEKWIWGEAFQQPHSKKGVVPVLLLGLCDRELELVGHDHGSENNAYKNIRYLTLLRFDEIFFSSIKKMKEWNFNREKWLDVLSDNLLKYDLAF